MKLFQCGQERAHSALVNLPDHGLENTLLTVKLHGGAVYFNYAALSVQHDDEAVAAGCPAQCAVQEGKQ